MRRLLGVATHPLTWMAATLSLNLYNNYRDRPTMCGTARRHVPWPAFCVGWGLLSCWLLPHYTRPLLNKVTDLTSS